MELRKLLEIIFRRKWIVLQAFLVITLTAAVCSYLLTPQYESSAKLLISSSDTASSLLSSIGLSDLTDLMSLTGSDTELQNNIALATVAPVLNEVINLLQLRDNDGNLFMPQDLLKSNIFMSTLFPRPKVNIAEIEETDLIEIQTKSPNPLEASMIANTLADIYIDSNLKQRRQEYGSARSFIDDQIKLAKAEYLRALEEIRSFKLQEKTIDINIETKIALEKVSELMQQKEDNIIDLAEVKAKIKTLKAQLSTQDERTVSGSAASENPQIEEIRKKILDMEFKLSEALAEKTPEHMDVKVLKLKISKAREELKKEMSYYQESSKDLQLLERELSALEIHLVNVNQDIEKYMDLLFTIPEKELINTQLMLKTTASQELYGALLEYLYQVGVAEAMTLSDIRLVEAAVEPDFDDPFFPNKSLNILLGALIGMIFGLGLAFLIDYFDDTIKTPDDAKRHSDLTLLGTIPRFKKKEDAIISSRDPKDPVSESYRTIRNSIKFSSLDSPVSNFLVTSVLAGEGKTTTSVNLGISITYEGKEVIIVDLDFRKPRIHEVFNIPNATGVTNVLSGEAALPDAAIKTDVPGLNILTSGPIPPDPGRMIESDKLHELIGELKKSYDFVIMDTPPLLVAHDSIFLSPFSDGTILVLESESLTLRAFSQARELLENANVRPLGMVLNKFKAATGSGYYHYYYKKGYYEGQRK